MKPDQTEHDIQNGGNAEKTNPVASDRAVQGFLLSSPTINPSDLPASPSGVFSSKDRAVKLLYEYRCELLVELSSIDNAIKNIMGKPMEKSISTPNAIISFLSFDPERSFRVSEMLHYFIKQNRIGADRKSFSANLSTTARRLADKGKITKTAVDVNGRNVTAYQYIHLTTDLG